jgi:hypothetical protein
MAIYTLVRKEKYEWFQAKPLDSLGRVDEIYLIQLKRLESTDLVFSLFLPEEASEYHF